MKILFDSTVLALALVENIAMHKTGIYRYAENLANHLSRLPEVQLSFYSMLNKQEIRLWQTKLNHHGLFQNIHLVNHYHPLKAKIDRIKQEMKEASKIKRIYLKGLCESYRFFQNSSAALAGSFGEQDLFYSPYHPIPKRIKDKKNIGCFTMVHDLIPLKYPGFFKVDKRGFFNSILKKAKPNHFFIAPSISTKSDICHYYSIDPNKIFVVAGAVQDELFYPVKDQQVLKETLEKYQIQGPYILSLATLEPRKNILALIDAYIDLVQQYPWFEHKLVLGGAKGWGLENLRQKIKPYADKIILTGFIKETDLAAVYSGATAFVYPSLYEGFGFPPLEAMKCQTPVIVSSSSSLPEIVQNAGLYVSPTSPEDIASQILKLINNPSLQQELKDLGTKQAAKYSWSQTTQETFKVFETGLLQVR